MVTLATIGTGVPAPSYLLCRSTRPLPALGLSEPVAIALVHRQSLNELLAKKAVLTISERDSRRF
jgi:hypothetical protein